MKTKKSSLKKLKLLAMEGQREEKTDYIEAFADELYKREGGVIGPDPEEIMKEVQFFGKEYVEIFCYERMEFVINVLEAFLDDIIKTHEGKAKKFLEKVKDPKTKFLVIAFLRHRFTELFLISKELVDLSSKDFHPTSKWVDKVEQFHFDIVLGKNPEPDYLLGWEETGTDALQVIVDIANQEDSIGGWYVQQKLADQFAFSKKFQRLFDLWAYVDLVREPSQKNYYEKIG